MSSIRLVQRRQSDSWQAELANAITTTEELLCILKLGHLAHCVIQQPGFKLLVPRCFVDKMQPGDADDPLLQQVLPALAEDSPAGITDPVGDLNAMTAPGLLHKYHGRVLLVTTGACAVHCRYCFRRHFPYSNANPRKGEWSEAVNYIRSNEDVAEVILSGGDPLVLDNDILQRLIALLEDIPHLQWLRIHSRLPVVLPSRIDETLVRMLQQSRLRTTLVIHANHANEITDIEMAALKRLGQAGITLLNQSVLLKGINDSIAALATLSKRLYEAGVLPYYLHMLDPVQGAMHFDVPQSRATALIDSLRLQLPGYLVPRLVREEPGKGSKTAIFTI